MIHAFVCDDAETSETYGTSYGPPGRIAMLDVVQHQTDADVLGRQIDVESADWNIDLLLPRNVSGAER